MSLNKLFLVKLNNFTVNFQNEGIWELQQKLAIRIARTE